VLQGRKKTVSLKNEATDVWAEQQAVLDHAGKLIQEAGRQVQAYSRTDVAPRLQSAVEPVFQTVGRAGAVTKQAAVTAKDKVVDDVFPAVSKALVQAATVLELAKSQKVREAIARGSRKVVPVPAKSGPGVGTWLLIGAGVVLAAGVAYAAWQTFKADESLFISDDELEPLTAED
jgi:flagellar hook-basal body complex protein FliE